MIVYFVPDKVLGDTVSKMKEEISQSSGREVFVSEYLRCSVPRGITRGTIKL